MRKELLTRYWQEGPCTPFQGAVQKVGFAEAAKPRVSSAGLCGAGRSDDYSQLTKSCHCDPAGQVSDYPMGRPCAGNREPSPNGG
jgi:hypothetical protein